MGLIGCPEMSVRNYHYLLLNNPKSTVFIILLNTVHNMPEKKHSTIFIVRYNAVVLSCYHIVEQRAVICFFVARRH